MQRVQRSTLLTAAILAGGALTGAAHAQVIRITNVNAPTGHDIPLKANSSVQIDSAGNLLAECALNTNNQCSALSSGGNANAPTANLTRIDTDAALTAGESVRLAWSSTNAEACKVSSTGPSNTTFSGVRATALAAGEVVTVSAQGNYTFSLVCYNSAGGSTASTVTVSVAAGGGGDPQDPGCTITSTDPSFTPDNFAMIEKTWTWTFSAPDGNPVATYPKGIAFPGPVPRLSKGQYSVIPITPATSEYVNLYWDQVQAKTGETYTVRPAAGMFFAISPCKGDLREPVAGSPDQFLRPGCRVFGNAASIKWTTSTQYQESSDVICKLVPNQTYYLHILSANPAGGLETGEHSCDNVPNSQTGCDVGVRIQAATLP
jgi:hypothetical protein